MSPRYQKSSEVMRYVETANTSHIKGDLKLGHMFIVFGNGNSQYASPGRPRCSTGERPAHMAATSGLASEKRLIEVRHFCWKRSRMAEISVPAWPMPIHQTKLTMPKAQATGMLLPQTPMPFVTV